MKPKKHVTKKEEKSILDPKFEMAELQDTFKELANLDDLWYFIKSSSVAWIAGSAN